MGFFSWTCAKTNLPIMASTSWHDFPDGCKAVLLTKDGSAFKGEYDGYGRLDGLDLVDDGRLDSGAAKLVLQKFWNGETFDQIPGRSRHEPGQGHFHDEEFIRAAYARGGFPSYEAYVQALDAYQKAAAEAFSRRASGGSAEPVAMFAAVPEFSGEPLERTVARGGALWIQAVEGDRVDSAAWAAERKAEDIARDSEGREWEDVVAPGIAADPGLWRTVRGLVVVGLRPAEPGAAAFGPGDIAGGRFRLHRVLDVGGFAEKVARCVAKQDILAAGGVPATVYSSDWATSAVVDIAPWLGAADADAVRAVAAADWLDSRGRYGGKPGFADALLAEPALAASLEDVRRHCAAAAAAGQQTRDGAAVEVWADVGMGDDAMAWLERNRPDVHAALVGGGPKFR